VGAAEQNGGPNELAFEAYGLQIAVGANRPELLDKIREVLPPGAQSVSPAGVQSRFDITVTDKGSFTLKRDGEELSGVESIDLDLALEMLETQLRLYLGTRAPDMIFFHAGAVAHRGKAIVIPATSFAGKTTLVAALVRAGAVYYSDEFAVVDRRGLVHPYAKPLSLREVGGWEQTDHTIEALGGNAGVEPVPVGMVVITNYQPGAKWQPQRLTSGAGAMALLSNAVPAQERPDEVMQAIRYVAQDAIILQSERDEADALAPQLLAELDRHVG
jgi:hypothetical protein